MAFTKSRTARTICTRRKCSWLACSGARSLRRRNYSTNSWRRFGVSPPTAPSTMMSAWSPLSTSARPKTNHQVATGYSPEVAFLLHGDLRCGIAKNHHCQAPFGGIEKTHLGLGAVMEGSHRWRNPRNELRQAGRTYDVAFTVGHAILGRQIGRQGRQYGSIHVAQAIEQRAQFRGIRLVSREREQVVAMHQIGRAHV